MKTITLFNRIMSWITKTIAIDCYRLTGQLQQRSYNKQQLLNQRMTRFSLIQMLLLISILLMQGSLNAHADTTASTDDRSTATPTAWWVYTGVNASYIASQYNANGARLTDIEIHSIVGGVPYFTVRMVKNSGNYAVPGWWWYYGLTFSQISPLLTQNNGRLIDLEPYDIGGGNIRYALIMVSNTNAAARTWWWYSGVSASQLSAYITSTGGRIIDLDSFYVGANQYYSAVLVANNTRVDAKAWQWWLNQTAAGVSAKLSAFNGRLVDIERMPNGLYNAVMVKNTGADAYAWWWQLGFTSITDLFNYANQLATRPVDIETYVENGVRRYSAVFIDNANAATRRIRNIYSQSFLDASGNPTRGIFEAYLKQVGSSVLVDLNSSRSAETASSLKSLHLLHAMRSVQAGESLASPFTYYDYISGTFDQRKNACPDPAKEISANRMTNYNLETGLDEMMRISDNRTTRGVVLRYGFPAINTTADMIGMVGTQLRHNIGCAYWNFATNKYDTGLRNDTTAADLARIYEGVWNSTFLTGTARSEFLESANPNTTGVGGTNPLQIIINEEAALQGKSIYAAQFGALVRSWGKGGSYGTCLPNAVGGCGQTVMIRSGTGIIRFPIKVTVLGVKIVDYRTYVFGRLISDVPTVNFSSPDIAIYDATYAKASTELYREEIRSALATW